MTNVMRLVILAMSPAALLLLTQMAVVRCGVPRTVDAKMFKQFIANCNPEHKLKVTMGIADARLLTVTRIEMRSSTDKEHWISVVFLENAQKEKSTITLDYTVMGERICDPSFTAKYPESNTDFTAAKPEELYAVDLKKSFTLEQLLKCVTDLKIKDNNAKCLIYTYRMIRFGNSQCQCNECVMADDPLAQMKGMIEHKGTFWDKAKRFFM